MVDFKKKLGKAVIPKKVNPIELYESLDRRSQAGPLRPSQNYILSKWFEENRQNKDLIVKLHTGEGKTLVGLLILQSRLNADQGPCLYACPNIYLVKQTCLEAEKFGISYCTIEEDNVLPEDFLLGNKILITHIQKLFNGKTIFGLDAKSIDIKNIILDDSHACIDSLKSGFSLKINYRQDLYKELFQLFEEDLSKQGEGSLLEIKNADYNSLLPIPYWSWMDKKTEVLNLIVKYVSEDFIKFAWPLIKDSITNWQGFVSGQYIEISPVHIPIHRFGFFSKAKQRILMSATTQDDSFFIKGLGFSLESVKHPLTFNNLKWSGEKMMLIPSLIEDSLDRDLIITRLSKSNDKRSFGIVSIVPDFNKSKQYEIGGALVANPENIFKLIDKLKTKHYEHTVVLANRYDGIDLPDEACRILIIDSKPFFDSLTDRYEENCRINSDLVNIKVAQRIEQGLGRSVRGEKDYSVIIIIGADLIKFIKSPLTNKYFSSQTRKQVEIGIAVADLAKEDLDESVASFTVINSLIKQALSRDEGWKEFYKEEMDKIKIDDSQNDICEILVKEKEAEGYFSRGEFDHACDVIQKLSDSFVDNPHERGWYLQILARYKYGISKSESNNIQKSAFQANQQLLAPRDGINYKKLQFINDNRIKRIKQWIQQYSSFQELMISIEGILNDLSFGIQSEKFETALKDIGLALGFLSQRPDKEFKKGPDNLWCGVNNQYFIFECKSDVDPNREEIKKAEASQMNSHCAWFQQEYGDVSVKRILVIPTKNLSSHANFSHDVEVMRKGKLREFKSNIKSFFQELKNYSFIDITDELIQANLATHSLELSDFKSKYTEKYTITR